MGIKLSEVEKVGVKKLQIIGGKPEWHNYELNGEIKFNNLDEELINRIKNEVIDILAKEERESYFVYVLLPYLTDMECDISIERFEVLLNTKNDVILALADGIMDLINGIIEYSEKIKTIEEKSSMINKKLPNLNELKKVQLEELYDKFSQEKDNGKRNKILREIIELKKELGEE